MSMYDYSKIEGRNMQMAARIPNISFYVPFLYVTLARMGTVAKSLSLLLIYVVPTYYFFLLTHQFDFSTTPIYLICFALVYTLYEMGYIQNDTETIKKEKNPSMWLWPSNLSYYARHRSLIYAVRLVVASGLGLLLLWVNGYNEGTYLFLLMASMIAVTYQVYNRVRSRWSLLLFVFLQIFRYLPYMVLLSPNIDWKATMALFISFPLCYITERSSHPRFKIRWVQKLIPDKEFLTRFRVYYYLFFSLLCVLLFFLGMVEWYYGVVLFYFLCYRVAVAVLVRYKRPKNYLVR